MTVLAADPVAPQASTALEVSVYTPSAPEGTIRIALFAGAEGFPDDPIHSVVLPAEPVTRDSAAVAGAWADAPAALWRIRVPPGVYAVAAVHDLNGNGRLDTNFLGMPKEPYGFSRAARGRFGPPSFEDAALRLDLPLASVRVETR